MLDSEHGCIGYSEKRERGELRICGTIDRILNFKSCMCTLEVDVSEHTDTTL